jgi:hypothetical protein
MPFAPSVGMHAVPPMSVGEAIRVAADSDGSSDEDDVDVIISRESKRPHYISTLLARAETPFFDHLQIA